MRKFTLLTLGLLVVSGAFATENAAELGYNHGFEVPTATGGKGTVIDLSDGTIDNGVCWQYGGVIAWPDLAGTFVSGFKASDAGLTYPIYLEAFQLGLTTNSAHSADVNLCVFGDNTGEPDGAVGGDALWSETVSCSGWTIPNWPAWAYTDIDVNPDFVLNGDFYVGAHPEWPGAQGQFYFGIDNTGTYAERDWCFIATGIGYPEGWQRIGTVWGGNNNLLFTAEVSGDATNPTITDRYPTDGAVGVDLSVEPGCHWQDELTGINTANSTFTLKAFAPVSGTLNVDDTDPLDVIVTFTPDTDLDEGTTYTVTTHTEDNAGNGADDTWTFDTVAAGVESASLGTIKAEFK